MFEGVELAYGSGVRDVSKVDGSKDIDGGPSEGLPSGGKFESPDPCSKSAEEGLKLGASDGTILLKGSVTRLGFLDGDKGTEGMS
jgi:hypothetical protein